MAFVFNPFTGNFDIADTVTFSPPAVDLGPYELKTDSESRDKDLQDQIDELEKSAFDEAPEDGTPYGRQDAGWVSITVFVDAPEDGKQYVRKDGTWEEVTVGTGDVEEAPEDGTPYSRQDGGWVPAGSGDFEEPPADDLPYVRSTPSGQADPANPVGEWLQIYHTDSNKVYVTDTNPGYDDPVRGDAGVKVGDTWYNTKSLQYFVFRPFPLTGQNEWVELTKGSSNFVQTISTLAPIAKSGSNTEPILFVDLLTLSALP